MSREHELQAQADFARTGEDQPVVIDLTANDGFAATGTVSIILLNGTEVSPGDTVKLPDGGIVSLRADGTVEFDPAGAYDGLLGGERAFESFDYTISDGEQTASATARVAIVGRSDPLVARNDLARTNEDELVLIDLTQNDRFSTSTVTINVLNGVEVSVGDTVKLEDGGLLTLRDDGIVAFDPNGAYEDLDAGQRALERFSYGITDGTNSDTASARVVIAGRDDGPVARNDTARTTEDELVFIDLTDNDQMAPTGTVTIVGINGVDMSPGDTVKLEDGGIVTLRGDGVVMFDPNGAYEDLEAGQRAVERFQYTISDGTYTASATARVLIAGRDEDDRPQGFVTDSFGL